MSVTRVAWSPDGNFIGKFRFMHCGILIGLWSLSLSLFLCAGVAYTKHLIHLYAFSGPNELRQHAEVSIRFDPYDKQCDVIIYPINLDHVF